MKKPVTNFLPEGLVKERNEQAKEIMNNRNSPQRQSILQALTREKEYEVDGKKHKGRVARSPYTGTDFPVNREYERDPASWKKAKTVYKKHKDVVTGEWELTVFDFAEQQDYDLYQLGKGKAEFFDAKKSLVEEEKKLAEQQQRVTKLKEKLWLEEKVNQDKLGRVEQAKEEWEKSMNKCAMPNIWTAIRYYNKANVEDKAQLREVLRYEQKSVVIVDDTGKDIFRSHWMLQPELLLWREFKKEPYNTEAWSQTNVGAQWQDWFEVDTHAPDGSYELKQDVLKATGMKDIITAGNDLEWNKIFNLFAKFTNNAGSQEIPWQQVARQMLWMSWYVWTNQKVSSDHARNYEMLPELCRRDDYCIDSSSLSVVGLERLHTDY